jgi:hypothetical protein
MITLKSVFHAIVEPIDLGVADVLSIEMVLRHVEMNLVSGKVHSR